MTSRVERELTDFLSQARGRIDDALDRGLSPLGTPPPILHEALRAAALAGGKRVRGALLLATAEMLRGDDDAALELACAVEMVHSCSLVLDDLPSMDDATMRRGKPALHRVFGEAIAILAAIALLNAAYERVWRAPGVRDRDRRTIALRLAEAIGGSGLIGGQVGDLSGTGRSLDLSELEYIHSHKTGALFIASVELGALSARAKPREIEALNRYAKNLGLAFQITDDLLDYSGNPDVTGKDAGLDRDKTTFVTLSGIAGAQHLVDELIDAASTAVAPFGRRAKRLVALAEMVRGRDR